MATPSEMGICIIVKTKSCKSFNPKNHSSNIVRINLPVFRIGEDNNRGYCGDEKGNWWKVFKEISSKNMQVLTTGDGKFLTYQDFKARVKSK